MTDLRIPAPLRAGKAAQADKPGARNQDAKATKRMGPGALSALRRNRGALLRWFENQKLVRKFSILFLVMLVVVGVLGGASLFALARMGAVSWELYHEHLRPYERAQMLSRSLFASRMLLFRHYSDFEVERMKVIRGEFEQNHAQTEELLGGSAGMFAPEVVTHLDQFRELWAKLGESSRQVMASGEEYDKEESLELLDKDNRKLFEEAEAVLVTLSAQLSERSAESYQSSQRILWTALGALIALFLAAAAITVALSRFATRVIARPLGEVVQVVDRVSSGDLSGQLALAREDELGQLGQAVARMTRNLRGILQRLGSNAKTLAASSEELSAISSELASRGKGIAEQAGMVSQGSGEMAAAIEGVAGNVGKLNADLQAASASVQHTSDTIAGVSGAVESINRSIGSISGSAEKSRGITTEAMRVSRDASGAVRALGEAAGTIDQVTQAIKLIAERTNLLALNAMIEAAKAGAAGAGFRVVANEIKELSHQSAKSAEEISAHILGIRKGSDDSVKAIEAFDRVVDQIEKSVSEITDALAAQRTSAAQISGHAKEVSAASERNGQGILEISAHAQAMARKAAEGSRSAGQVSANVDGVHRSIEQFNEGVLQISASSQDLARIAAELDQMAREFKTE